MNVENLITTIAILAGALVFRWWTEKIKPPRQMGEEFPRLFPPEKLDDKRSTPPGPPPTTDGT